MASGTLANLCTSAFVATRTVDAERICRNLLSLPATPWNVLDPTSGEGDLLLPFAAHPRADLWRRAERGARQRVTRAAAARADCDLAFRKRPHYT